MSRSRHGSSTCCVRRGSHCGSCGYLFRFLNERAGGRIAFPLSAACFSVIHFNWSGLVVYFVVGLLFAWSCRRTATLTAPITAHVVYNGAAFGLALFELGR